MNQPNPNQNPKPTTQEILDNWSTHAPFWLMEDPRFIKNNFHEISAKKAMQED